jgi:sensor histidine kinase YesM
VVAEELEFLERYLEIERIRFGERLHVGVELDSGSADALVPSMILQPLVENALRHGILRREEGGSIRITARRDNGRVSLSVQDDGPGMAGEDERRNVSGIGLSNTRTRLHEMYGAAADLLLEDHGAGVRVSISLPYRNGSAAAREESA